MQQQAHEYDAYPRESSHSPSPNKHVTFSLSQDRGCGYPARPSVSRSRDPSSSSFYGFGEPRGLSSVRTAPSPSPYAAAADGGSYGPSLNPVAWGDDYDITLYHRNLGRYRPSPTPGVSMDATEGADGAAVPGGLQSNEFVSYRGNQKKSMERWYEEQQRPLFEFPSWMRDRETQRQAQTQQTGPVPCQTHYVPIRRSGPPTR